MVEARRRMGGEERVFPSLDSEAKEKWQKSLRTISRGSQNEMLTRLPQRAWKPAEVIKQCL